MKKSSLLITTALVFSTSSAFAGGTLGGNHQQIRVQSTSVLANVLNTKWM